METYTDTSDQDVKKKTLNLITHVEVEKASKSDAKTIIPAIEKTKKRKLEPEVLNANTLYGSDCNSKYAKSKGIDLISPAKKTTAKERNDLSRFKFSDDGHVISCPMRIKPLRKYKNVKYSQDFCLKTCSMCLLLKNCPVVRGTYYYYLYYHDKKMQIVKKKAFEKTSEFKNRYRWRAGIEAEMSQYDRRTGVKKLRVRGMNAVQFSAVLKATGLNIFRAAAVRRAESSSYNSSNLNYFCFLNHF